MSISPPNSLKTDDPGVAKWRVLVVDDEPDSLELVRLVLNLYGATVFVAENGVEGFKAFQKEKPTIILTDLSMPERDGWQLLTEIRTASNGTHIPVIALTAHAMTGDKEKVMEAGFDGYLSKPLHMVSFLDDLKACLKGVRSPADGQGVKKDE